MRVCLSIALLSGASAFVPSTSTSSSSSIMSASLQQQGSALRAAGSSSRQEFLSAAVAGGLAGMMGLVVAPSTASAAKYGGFGAGSPEVLLPSDVDIDVEVLRSGPVQSALSKIKSHRDVVSKMKSMLAGDGQVNLRSTIIKELDLSVLRASLNMVNSALDEDGQRGTDRLIRVILQDITELEIANAQKDGVPRSPRRLEILQNKLAKLDQAFDDYLAFFV